MSAREMKKIRAENLKCYLDFILYYLHSYTVIII